MQVASVTDIFECIHLLLKPLTLRVLVTANCALRPPRASEVYLCFWPNISVYVRFDPLESHVKGLLALCG